MRKWLLIFCAALMIIGSSITCFAAESPKIPNNIIFSADEHEYKESKSNYYISKKNGAEEYLVIYANSPAVYPLGKYMGGNSSNLGEECLYVRLDANGDELSRWTGSAMQADKQGFNLSTYTIGFATSDVRYYIDNTVFFQQTPKPISLSQVVGKMQKQATIVLSQTVSYLEFLIPWVIGLVACLVGVNLLPKILLKFL